MFSGGRTGQKGEGGVRRHLSWLCRGAGAALSLALLPGAVDAGAQDTPTIVGLVSDHPVLFFCIAILGMINGIMVVMARWKLKASEHRHRAFFEDNGAVMLLVDPATGRVMDANRAACSFYGWNRVDLLTLRIADINIMPEAQVCALMGEVLKREKRQFRACHRLASGEIRDVEVYSHPFSRDGRECLLSIISDVTGRLRAELALEESEQRYRRIVETTMEGIVSLDHEHRITYANQRLEEMLGLSADQIVGRLYGDLMFPEDLPEYESRMAARRRGSSGYYEQRLCRGDGTELWCRVSATAVMEDGVFRGSFGMFSDITAHRRMEEELRRSEEQAWLFIESSPIAILVQTDGRIAYANPAAVALFGAGTADLIVGGRIIDRVHPRYHGMIQERMTRLNRDRLPVPVAEISYLRLDGSPVEVEVSTVPITYNGERGSLAYLRDITSDKETARARQQADEAIRASEARYRILFQRMPSGIFQFDHSLRVTDCNERFVEIIGSRRERLIGLDLTMLRDLTPLPLLRSALAGEEGYIEGKYATTTSDREIWGSLRVAPLRDAGGGVTGGIGILEDITARRNAELEVERARDEWARTFDAVPDLIAILDGEFTIVRVNRAMAAILGVTPTEAVGMRCFETIHGVDAPPAICPHNLLLRDMGEHTAEVYEPCLGGHLMVTVSPLHDAAGNFIGSVHVARDINDRVRAEEALRLSEERYRRISELTSDFVFSCRRTGAESYRLDWITGATDAICGYSCREILAMTCWLRLVIDEDRADISARLDDLRPGESAVLECRIALRTGEIRWLRCNAVCLSGDTDERILYGSAQDITGQKQGQEQIIASLREKEMLLKEIHHRVKNNLQIISSLLNLQSVHIDKPELVPLFLESQNRVRSMALIHEKLYRSDNLAAINFGAYVKELTTFLFRSYQTGASRVRLQVETEDITFGIDTAVPCGLLLNELVSNALRHAFPHGEEGELRVALHRNADGAVTLMVADTGVGLPEEFDINRTSTLGMELIRSLTTQIDGNLDIGRDTGTAFIVTFRRQD